MALREEWERTGRWLFRHRGHLPVVVLTLVLAYLAVGDAPGSPVLDGVALAVALLGLVVRAATAAFVPKGTSGRGTVKPAANVLNTTGVYSVVRHPLYLGNYLCWLGAVLLTGSWTLVLLVSLLFWIYYERIMFAEEEYLRGRFGPEFEAWAERTPAFVPRLRNWTRPDLTFSLPAMLVRERSSILAVATVFTALIFARDAFAGSGVAVHPFWLGFLGFAVLNYVVAKAMQRRRRMRYAEERG